ncbi:MAG: family 16 glycoside hydrolase [Bryobacteraceae bacterium]
MPNPSFNHNLTRRTFVSALAASSLAVASDTAAEWISLFDGESLNGWRPSEHKSSWAVSKGMLTANGPRSHLFYVGPAHAADFKNFELEVELITQPGCNSGVYFHTAYQESGFPEKGFEVQVNNTARGDGGYLERKKTGSLYGLRNIYKQLVPDQQPFRMAVAVRGKNVQIRLNGELLVDYLEPSPPVIPAGGEKYRFLDHGTFALQCHNDGSKAAYKTVRVRPLPDPLPAYTGPAPVVDDTYRAIIDIGRHNLPMVDFHVYLRPGLSLEQALRKSRNDGIQYGIAANASDFRNDDALERWRELMARKPVFLALSTDNADWMKNLSQRAAKQFDYVIANGNGASIDTLLKRLHDEPIDILSGLGAVPNEGAKDLITALIGNKVALELNTVHRTPSEDFILQAKEAGCKFAFGTANANAAELKRCEYGLQMVEQCKLGWQHFFTPIG